MAQTAFGAMKSIARRLGMSVEDIISLRANGFHRCRKCETWKKLEEFSTDRTRQNGRSYVCRECGRVKIRVSTKGRVSAFKGRTHSADARAAMSRAKKGQASPKKGIKRSVAERISISQGTRRKTPRGKDCHSYKDGKLAERRGERFGSRYKRWRYDVFVRDNFACRYCGDSRGGNLRAHHLKSFAEFSNLRFEVSNGITLCDPCHKDLHAKGDPADGRE